MDRFPLFQVRVVDLLAPSIVSPDTLITVKSEHKELWSSWHNLRWLKPPNRTRHSGGGFYLFVISGGLGAVAFIH